MIPGMPGHASNHGLNVSEESRSKRNQEKNSPGLLDSWLPAKIFFVDCNYLDALILCYDIRVRDFQA